MEFHRIPWNSECAYFDDTSSSMEFLGIWSAPISLTREVPWNSMEFHGTCGVPISLTRAVPWNSLEFLGTWNAPISLTWEVYGIPWNLVCANFADPRSAPILMTRAVAWNSMELEVRQLRWHEQFYGIPWNPMELGVRLFRWHEQFHGITWNLECANFADTSSSMDVQVIPWN